MGKTIEQIAAQRGHNIALIIDSKNANDFSVEMLKEYNIDAAIEFSTPNFLNDTSSFTRFFKLS